MSIRKTKTDFPLFCVNIYCITILCLFMNYNRSEKRKMFTLPSFPKIRLISSSACPLSTLLLASVALAFKYILPEETYYNMGERLVYNKPLMPENQNVFHE